LLRCLQPHLRRHLEVRSGKTKLHDTPSYIQLAILRQTPPHKQHYKPTQPTESNSSYISLQSNLIFVSYSIYSFFIKEKIIYLIQFSPVPCSHTIICRHCCCLLFSRGGGHQRVFLTKIPHNCPNIYTFITCPCIIFVTVSYMYVTMCLQKGHLYSFLCTFEIERSDDGGLKSLKHLTLKLPPATLQ
jgi:hypothetical protein